MGCVIVGGGAAGLHAALTCRQCWPEESVTLIEAEGEVGYYRTLLPLFMAGQIKEDKLFFWHPGDDHLFTVRSGIKVGSLDRENQNLHLENQENLHYERLILAPGGYPFMPSVCVDKSCRGIFPVRDLTTARDIRKWIPRHKKIVVLGGGFVGLKTAVSLGTAGFTVVLVEKESHLLPQALTREAARPVEGHLQRMGINVVLGHVLEDIHAEKRALASVKVGGDWLPCDTLLVAIGSTPNVGFLEGSDLLDNGELLVSATLQTRDEKIYAAGDAVKISIPGGKRCTPWIWPQAVTQGKLAGANLYRSPPFYLKALTRPNSLNLHGLSVVILGAPVPEAEVIRYASPGDGIHRELFIHDGRIVGGALVGDISGAGPLHAAIITEKQQDKGLYDVLRPSGWVLSRLVGDCYSQRRQARLLFHQEVKA
ncbi:MAG: FAD-dependent oxidoreductase [Proteobacteria bacterium]|nr:FAD-dependent oxidoreductase [Pseudomonadota bacterium]